MDRKIEQPAIEVWRGFEDGMIYIGQDDRDSIIVIHPLVLPQIITWLQELLTETQPEPEF